MLARNRFSSLILAFCLFLVSPLVTSSGFAAIDSDCDRSPLSPGMHFQNDSSTTKDEPPPATEEELEEEPEC